MTDKKLPDDAPHTERRTQDEATLKAAKKADAKRKGADLLPDPADDDTLDDLFNDMPV